jgi:hypothetical protein
VSPAAFPDWADDLVVDLDGDEDPDKVAARMMAEELGERPLLLGAGGPYPSIRFNHALGDARVGGPLFVAALTAAVTGRPARYPFPRPTPLPLLRAAVHQFGRHPARLPAALRICRMPSTVEGELVDWAPAEVIHRARSRPGGPVALRRWRDAYAPGTSIGAVLAAAVAASFGRYLPAPGPGGVMMLVDARRYLPAGAVVDGNFAAGDYLAPADPTDPRAVHELVAARLVAGRGLGLLALHHARLLVNGAPAAPVVTAVPAAVDLDVSGALRRVRRSAVDGDPRRPRDDRRGRDERAVGGDRGDRGVRRRAARDDHLPRQRVQPGRHRRRHGSPGRRPGGRVHPTELTPAARRPCSPHRTDPGGPFRGVDGVAEQHGDRGRPDPAEPRRDRSGHRRDPFVHIGQ